MKHVCYRICTDPVRRFVRASGRLPEGNDEIVKKLALLFDVKCITQMVIQHPVSI